MRASNIPLRRLFGQYLVARGLPALSSMALTLMCVRFMSAHDYGRYTLLLTPILLAAGFAASLSGQATLRWGLSLTRSERRKCLWYIPLSLSVLGSIPAWWALPLPDQRLPVAGVVLALLPLLALIDTRRSLFVAAGCADQVLRLDGLRALSALLFAGTGFALWPATPMLPLLAMVGGACLALLLVPVSVPVDPHANRRVDAAYLKYGLWYALWVLIQGGMGLFERHMVHDLAGLSDAGMYAARTDVFTAICNALGGIVGATLMPRYLSWAQSHDEALGRRLLGIGIQATASAAVICLLLLVLLNQAPAAWVGASLQGNHALSVAVLAASVIWLAVMFLHKPLELRGATNVMLLCIAASALVFLLLAAFCAGRWGAVGVAMAKAVSGLLYAMLVCAAARWQTREQLKS